MQLEANFQTQLLTQEGMSHIFLPIIIINVAQLNIIITIDFDKLMDINIFVFFLLCVLLSCVC